MSSYLVIARKWRPSLFEEIVGQRHVTRTLTNAVSSGRVAHAYLFSGPRGVGKTTAARILAKSLNCEKGPTPAPCNECSSCRSIAAGSSVDVFEIDGASNTSVDNVRELRENVRYVPGESRYRVYIIDEVHMLSTSAFNALLKTLEEPPPHAVFIFATTEVHKIPPTILSRCQRFDFKRIPFEEIRTHLGKILDAEGIEYSPGALAVLAREADGSLRDAQSLLDQVLAFSESSVSEADVTEGLGLMDRGVFVELLASAIKGDGRECLNIIEKIYEFGYDFKRASADLLEYIRDLTVIKVSGGADSLDLPDTEAERLGELSDEASAEKLQMLFDVMSRGYEEVSRSSFPRYSFEMAVLKAASLEDVEPLEDVIARLEDLSGRLSSGSPGRPRTARPAPPAAEKKPARQAGPARGGAEKGVKKAGAEDLKPRESMEGPRAEEAASGYKGDLKGFIARKIRSLSGAMADVEATVDSSGVSLAVPEGAIKIFELKKDHLVDVCREFLDRPVKVFLKTAPPGETPERGEAGSADPLVKEAVRVFGGRVIEDRRRENVQ